MPPAVNYARTTRRTQASRIPQHVRTCLTRKESKHVCHHCDGAPGAGLSPQTARDAAPVSVLLCPGLCRLMADRTAGGAEPGRSWPAARYAPLPPILRADAVYRAGAGRLGHGGADRWKTRDQPSIASVCAVARGCPLVSPRAFWPAAGPADGGERPLRHDTATSPHPAMATDP